MSSSIVDLSQVCQECDRMKDQCTCKSTKGLTAPIVEGAYYEREDGAIMGPFRPAARGPWRNGEWFDGRRLYRSDGTHYEGRPGERLTRRVWLVPTDPAEVVAELLTCEEHVRNTGYGGEEERGKRNAFDQSAEIVAARLGVNSEHQAARYSTCATNRPGCAPDLDEVIRELLRELHKRSELAVNGGDGEDRAKAAAYSEAADLVAEKLGVGRG